MHAAGFRTGSVGEMVPVFARIFDRHIDEHGHEKAQDGGAIAYLVPIDLAVPGRAAVDALVAKDVEPVEHEAQDRVTSTVAGRVHRPTVEVQAGWYD